MAGEQDLGRLVIGEAKAARFAAQAQDGSSVLGPRVVDGAPTPPAPPEASTLGAPSPDGFSVASIKKLLGDEPEQFDRLFAAEMARPDLRRGALRVFASAERKRVGGARPEVLAQIEAQVTEGAR